MPVRDVPIKVFSDQTPVELREQHQRELFGTVPEGEVSRVAGIL